MTSVSGHHINHPSSSSLYIDGELTWVSLTTLDMSLFDSQALLSHGYQPTAEYALDEPGSHLLRALREEC